jgi:hypothetical protein
VFTLHNLAYQGLFWAIDMQLTGLPKHLFNPQLEFHNRLNLLKADIARRRHNSQSDLRPRDRRRTSLRSSGRAVRAPRPAVQHRQRH